MTFYGIISRAKTFQGPQLSLRGPGLLDAGENVGRARISMWRSHDEGGKRQETKFQLVSEFFWDHLLTLNLSFHGKYCCITGMLVLFEIQLTFNFYARRVNFAFAWMYVWIPIDFTKSSAEDIDLYLFYKTIAIPVELFSFHILNCNN